VLDLLIDRVKTVPLLIVLTHRPEFQIVTDICQINSLRLPIQQLRTDQGEDVGQKMWASRSFCERKLRNFVPVCVI
jgi:hypothetical protein